MPACITCGSPLTGHQLYYCSEACTRIRDRERSARERAHRRATPRARSISQRHTVAELVALRLDDTSDLPPRPRTRGECGTERPCPWVGCRYHLYLDVSPRTGSIKLNHPDIAVEDMHESCALDVADAGEHTLLEVGALVNITRERVRQLEVGAVERLRTSPLADYEGYEQPTEE
jgi:hypothetical protein